MYKRILVPTDGSALSKKALAHAIRLAEIAGAELVVLHAVPRYPTSAFDGAMGFTPADIGRMEKQWNDVGHGIVDAAKKKAQAERLSVRGVVAHTDMPGEAIVAAARKYKCDLIVMASHGRRGIKRLLMGSETQHTLTHSHAPVLVLR